MKYVRKKLRKYISRRVLCSKHKEHICTYDHSKDMNGMFYGASSFNQYLKEWDVSNVTDTDGMFDGSGIDEDNKPKMK